MIVLDEMDIQIIIDALERDIRVYRFYDQYYPLLIGKLERLKKERESEILRRLEVAK